MEENKIHVVMANDFDRVWVDKVRDVSPRLVVTQHYPTVPTDAWESVNVLCTYNVLPTIQQAPKLRWVQTLSAGVEHLLTHSTFFQERSEVWLTNTSGIHASQIAEWTMGMILAWDRNLVGMIDQQARSTWLPREETERLFGTVGIRGKTLGIVGYGAIGREVARVASAFGMKILALKRDLKRLSAHTSYSVDGTGDPNADLPERLYPPEAVRTMVRDCDYVLLLLPLTDATRGFINAEVIGAMKRDAVLLNAARGAVVDEKALLDALRNKRIGGAILDVFEKEPLPSNSPFWGLPNVIVSPHVAGYSLNYHERVTEVFVENLRRYLVHQPLLNLIDFKHGY